MRRKYHNVVLFRISICMLFSALMGCASILYYSALFDYCDQVFEKGSSGYSVVVSYLKEHHRGAPSYFATHTPDVIATPSHFYRSGFCVVTFEENDGGHVFCHDGDDWDHGRMNLVGNEIVKRGYQVQRKYDNQKKLQARLKKLADEEAAIANPRLISSEDLIGIKAMTPLRDCFRSIGILPKKIGETEKFSFYPPKKYPAGTVPGLREIDGFRIVSLQTQGTNSAFRSVQMMNYAIPRGQEDDYATETIHALKAKLHTNIDPSYDYSRNEFTGSAREWKWDRFKMADDRLGYISFSIHTSNDRDATSFALFSFYDITETDKKEREAFRKQMKEWERKQKEEKIVKEEMREENQARNCITGAVAELFNNVKASLVVVKVDGKCGSGFLVKDDSDIYVYTNEHVIRGSDDMPTIETITGRTLHLGDFELAKGRDLARFRILDDVTDGLSLAIKEPNIETDITVFGNSDGADVATALSGRVIGVGPKLIEISAEFVQGNSGSPVIALDGKVIGIATFAVNTVDDENWMKKDTRFNGVRRFAYRIDNVRWKKMEWDLYSTIINR